MSEVLTEEPVVAEPVVAETAPPPAEPEFAAPEPPAGPDMLPAEPSEEFLRGYREAFGMMGYQEAPPSVDDPGYREWATAELERVRAANDQAVLEQAIAAGHDPYLAIAELNAQREQWRTDRVALAEQELAEEISQYEADRETVQHQIERIGAEGGVAPELLDYDMIFAVGEGAYQELATRYGYETANELAPQIVEGAVMHVASRLERGVANIFETVSQPLRILNPHADPVTATNLAMAIYPRMLREYRGDEIAAQRAAYRYGIESAAGDGVRATGSSVAAYHAALQRALPESPPPSPTRSDVKVNRDPNTGRFTTQPLAEKYATRQEPPKSVFAGMTDRQRATSERAYEILGPGNGPGNH